jgi:hypothetical protein
VTFKSSLTPHQRSCSDPVSTLWWHLVLISVWLTAGDMCVAACTTRTLYATQNHRYHHIYGTCSARKQSLGCAACQPSALPCGQYHVRLPTPTPLLGGTQHAKSTCSGQHTRPASVLRPSPRGSALCHKLSTHFAVLLMNVWVFSGRCCCVVLAQSL